MNISGMNERFTPDKTPIQDDNQDICCKRNNYTFGTWEYDEHVMGSNVQSIIQKDNEIRLQCVITTRDTTVINGYDIRNLRERSGTFRYYEGKFMMQQRKFTDWRKVWLGSESFPAMYQQKRMDATVLVDKELSAGTRTAPMWITQTRNGAYGTESIMWPRDMAKLRRTTDWIRRITAEKPSADSGYRVYNKNRPEQTFQVLKGQERTNVMLGMPWLDNENPRIDWKDRLERMKSCN